ncbi:DnaJ-like protein subfamily B member 11 [Trichoderma ghanense]|uniref:DnaJ-like protein subfamily B member 11 n=1 Tax=Trichoderma ghanense TaxID=65468 RepID=A0ABY2H5K6_9HYPO
MAPSQATEDYYKFLGIPQSAGKDAIRASYRKLALKYHPDRNPNNPQATAQFQLVRSGLTVNVTATTNADRMYPFQLEAAYSTLFDPERRRIYDLQYDSIKRTSATPDTSKNPPPPQADSSDHLYKLQIDKLDAAIQQLRNREDELAGQLSKARKECNESQMSLDRLQAVADMDAKEEANRNSWYGYFFSKQQSEEEKQARQRRMVDNRAARTVREAELNRLKTRVNTTQSLLDDLRRQILAKVMEKHRLQGQESKRQEAIRLAELRRQQAMQKEREERAREEADRRRREEQAERMRKAQEAEREWRAEEAERRRAQEAERIRRAQEARKHKEDLEEFFRQFQEDLPKNFNTGETHQGARQTKTSSERTQRGTGSRTGNSAPGRSAKAPEDRKSSCLHRSWWEKEEGRHECERCLDTTRRFAFRCPSCCMVACAGCRDILKRRF